jgi:hypothetical protein
MLLGPLSPGAVCIPGCGRLKGGGVPMLLGADTEGALR